MLAEACGLAARGIALGLQLEATRAETTWLLPEDPEDSLVLSQATAGHATSCVALSLPAHSAGRTPGARQPRSAPSNPVVAFSGISGKQEVPHDQVPLPQVCFHQVFLSVMWVSPQSPSYVCPHALGALPSRGGSLHPRSWPLGHVALQSQALPAPRLVQVPPSGFAQTGVSPRAGPALVRRSRSSLCPWGFPRAGSFLWSPTCSFRT